VYKFINSGYNIKLKNTVFLSKKSFMLDNKNQVKAEIKIKVSKKCIKIKFLTSVVDLKLADPDPAFKTI
jgi:hypothetical protein